MWKKLLLVLFLFFPILFSSVKSTVAEQFHSWLEVNFIQALIKKDERLAQSYMAEGVKLPILKENKPLKGFSGLPTSKKDVGVLIAFYDEIGPLGKPDRDRIALIWEITVKNNKITNIKVIY